MASHLLAEALARNPRFEVVAIVSPAELLRKVGDYRPDVAIVCADLEGGSVKGIEIVRQLHARVPEVRFLFLADDCDRDLVVTIFRAGASGIFCRAESFDNLCKCIERVHEGQIWADSRQVQFLVDALIATIPYRVVDARGNELLSGRELEVVQFAVRGYTNREIAEKMNLSEHTVKNYMFRVFDKLGVSNRVEMLFYILSQSGAGQGLASTFEASTTRTPIADWRKAAEAGSVSAQLALGTRFRSGTGVEKNKALAYFWLRLAEEQARDITQESKAALKNLKRRMDSAEVEAQERCISDWVATHRKKAVEKDRLVGKFEPFHAAV